MAASRPGSKVDRECGGDRGGESEALFVIGSYKKINKKKDEWGRLFKTRSFPIPQGEPWEEQDRRTLIIKRSDRTPSVLQSIQRRSLGALRHHARVKKKKTQHKVKQYCHKFFQGNRCQTMDARKWFTIYLVGASLPLGGFQREWPLPE